MKSTFTTTPNADEIRNKRFIAAVRACVPVRVAELLRTARTIHETVGNVLAWPILYLRRAKNLVECLKIVAEAAQFDKTSAPVDGDGLP